MIAKIVPLLFFVFLIHGELSESIDPTARSGIFYYFLQIGETCRGSTDSLHPKGGWHWLRLSQIKKSFGPWHCHDHRTHIAAFVPPLGKHTGVPKLLVCLRARTVPWFSSRLPAIKLEWEWEETKHAWPNIKDNFGVLQSNAGNEKGSLFFHHYLGLLYYWIRILFHWD